MRVFFGLYDLKELNEISKDKLKSLPGTDWTKRVSCLLAAVPHPRLQPHSPCPDWWSARGTPVPCDPTTFSRPFFTNSYLNGKRNLYFFCEFSRVNTKYVARDKKKQRG